MRWYHRAAAFLSRARSERFPGFSAVLASPATRLRGMCLFYNWPPFGRAGVRADDFLRSTLLRSLRASLLFRSRWNRDLSPLNSDMPSTPSHWANDLSRRLAALPYPTRRSRVTIVLSRSDFA